MSAIINCYVVKSLLRHRGDPDAVQPFLRHSRVGDASQNCQQQIIQQWNCFERHT